MPRLSIGKRSRLVAIFYQFHLETSGKKYDRLVDFRSVNKKCIIFIDNCRVHPPIQYLKNIKVLYFPPNVTSVCQPMDMGIIANLKNNYNNYLSNDKNKCLETGANFSINILDAMINLKKSWDDVSQTTIKNIFLIKLNLRNIKQFC